MAFRQIRDSILISLLLTSCSSLPNSYEAKLADHLADTGAKMYGAYWCPHCATQKKYFGGAASRIPYIECDEKGLNAQVELCQVAEIEAYPTWIIEGEYYLGAQPLRRLAELSGFDDDLSPGSTQLDVELDVINNVVYRDISPPRSERFTRCNGNPEGNLGEQSGDDGIIH